jgi:folate-binding protein YgfZ
MDHLKLREFHRHRGGHFTQVNGAEAVNDYGAWVSEHAALRQTAGVLDLSFRSRLCLTGAGRARFLHGQIPNEASRLPTGEGLYTVMTTERGMLKTDLNLFALPEEWLLDFEPGLAGGIARRLAKYLTEGKVRVTDTARRYGLWSVQGPRAEAIIRTLDLGGKIPLRPYTSVRIAHADLGELHLLNHARLINFTPGAPYVVFSKGGFDLLVSHAAQPALAERLLAAAKRHGGHLCGWQAFEAARIEAGIPRFGADMDETNHPLECRLEARGITCKKGRFVGREAIQRLRTLHPLKQELRGLRLADQLPTQLRRGDKLFHDGKEAGYLTSVTWSPLLQANIGFGYVRHEANVLGTKLVLKHAGNETFATIVELPFNAEALG